MFKIRFVAGFFFFQVTVFAGTLKKIHPSDELVIVRFNQDELKAGPEKVCFIDSANQEVACGTVLKMIRQSGLVQIQKSEKKKLKVGMRVELASFLQDETIPLSEEEDSASDHPDAGFLDLLSTGDFRFNGTVQGRLFQKKPLYTGQQANAFSLFFEPKYSYQSQDRDLFFNFHGFYLLDHQDSRRTHGDFRELDFLFVDGKAEFRLGFSKISWGVTESFNPVDIINQRDSVVGFDTKEKLGQPLLGFKWFFDRAVWEMYLMPYFREQTFPDRSGRLRAPVVVNVKKAEYESSEEEQHLAGAARYFYSHSGFDLGLSFFRGTARDPDLTVTLGDQSYFDFVPYYKIMEQHGLELRYVAGGGIWKAEFVNRFESPENYSLGVGGYEYTWNGVMESKADFSLALEYLWDSRRAESPYPWNEDIFLGWRYATNNFQSLELNGGLVYDLGNNSQFLALEISRKIGEAMKLEVNSYIFLKADELDITYFLRDDSFVEVSLRYFH